ncbi:MAG: hypothetical protein CL840_13390 [Crocinitomicaceae bacterium]|nr:hypothetical protein [Crocinitomicaceae bacterium]
MQSIPIRKSYDTSVKHLYRLGLDKLIDSQLSAGIHRSNIRRWKEESAEKYEGFELNKVANQQLELLQQYANNIEQQKNFKAYLKIIGVCRKIIHSHKTLKKVFLESKEELLDVVQKVSPAIGIKKAIKMIGISSTTYYHWLIQTKVKCEFSFFELCNKVYPNQLSKPEILKIKKLLTCEEFKFWPIKSIAYYAARTNQVNIHLSTFYRYVHLLGIKRPLFKKPPQKVGIRANQVHEIWHTDVTEIPLNGNKYYLHLLMDNYSRYILGWKLENKKRGSTLKKILANALSQYQPNRMILLVDGGRENINHDVNNLVGKHADRIKRLIAGKDIDFSNSMVEALNKIVKNRYLYLLESPNLNALKDNIAFSINNYNTIRPHGSLEGNTPEEILTNQPINQNQLRESRLEARKVRIAYNRINTCKKCN